MHTYVRVVHTARTYGPYVRVVRIGLYSDTGDARVPQRQSDIGDALVLRCRPGPVQPVVTSLVYSASVDDLTSYSRYEFQLSVVNDAGTSQPPVSSYAVTIPAGTRPTRDDVKHRITTKSELEYFYFRLSTYCLLSTDVVLQVRVPAESFHRRQDVTTTCQLVRHHPPCRYYYLGSSFIVSQSKVKSSKRDICIAL